MIFSTASMPSHRGGWLTMIGILVPPIVAAAGLYLVAAAFAISIIPAYGVLAVLAFVVTLAIYREMAAIGTTLARRPRDFLQRSFAAWAIVVSCLAVIGFALQHGGEFSRRVLLTWAVVTPVLIAACQYWSYVVFVHNLAGARKAVVAGVSDLSRRLAQSISSSPASGLTITGWFDDRGAGRTGPVPEGQLLGRLGELPQYVKANKIDVIYIALPIRHEERTKLLLDELHDTTASIYFVPDIFVFDLIQSRVDIIDGIPVLALCETPFYGINGLVKRMSDLLLATLILLLAAPIMLAVAIGVALTTPGSIIFKQRRYGLDGQQIIVYKFRSMSTSDDAATVKQAELHDPRITSFGRFIRRYSLDELPQLVNVVQGRMSLVGPRPHAVAHNEEYRRLIKGYMIRHKVAPGITGLAQIRGHRGETKTVEQMRARVESDLEYLRRWSLALDLKIIALTVLRMFSDTKAY
ncbi:MAG TPA: undecaprenyl-phosphate glucose phosphotransferase [Candidatus Baltobacteraceae bacterium]|jgi:putative colanic acid biosynthesis UDP-glucose lipid carrier transferase|nr:undecaprenyl-phosphate glucose phosphotransferase [Candidatus Baltobacteraceae bacterium]